MWICRCWNSTHMPHGVLLNYLRRSKRFFQLFSTKLLWGIFCVFDWPNTDVIPDIHELHIASVELPWWIHLYLTGTTRQWYNVTKLKNFDRRILYLILASEIYWGCRVYSEDSLKWYQHWKLAVQTWLVFLEFIWAVELLCAVSTSVCACSEDKLQVVDDLFTETYERMDLTPNIFRTKLLDQAASYNKGPQQIDGDKWRQREKERNNTGAVSAEHCNE